ncbi:MAG: hypothetical protein NTY66_02145, partial [Candidatus Vogelbacteria bacterium]|nr:hypothetical protein [Candidatus Vogelbacteria bacterium]
MLNKIKKAVWKKVSHLKTGAIIAIEKNGKLEWDEIVGIKSVGRERVYDIEVEGTHNFVGNGIIAHNTYIALTDTGDLNIAKDTNGNYQITDSSNNNSVIEKIGAFSKLLAADFEAGIARITEIIADKITVTGSLISPVVQTDLISPLADSDTVTIQTKNLVIENASGSAEVKIVGDLTAENASISGELYAESIVSPDLDKIQELLRQVKTDQDLLAQAQTWQTNTATDSAKLDQLAVLDLYVTNQGAFNSLSVANTMTIGSDLVIQSSLDPIYNILYTSLDTLTAPLKIQSLALAPLEIKAGLVTIDTHGNVQIAGNLFVAGRIHSSGLTLKMNQDSRFMNQDSATDSASLLSLQNSGGQQVGSVDASGSARFSNLSTQGLTIAGADATSAGTIVNGVITTNSTVGQATIPAGTSEITIKNPKVTDYTLVYVTPTSCTQNNVLYVKSKQAGQFVVGFTNPLDIEVKFN